MKTGTHFFRERVVAENENRIAMVNLYWRRSCS